MDYTIIIEKAVEEIKKLEGVSKILLYGSVAKGVSNPHDVDIAILLNDLMKFMHLDLEGLPMDFMFKLGEIKRDLEKICDVLLHLVVYWQSEFDKGVVLDGGRRYSPDTLNQHSIIKFDSRLEERL